MATKIQEFKGIDGSICGVYRTRCIEEDGSYRPDGPEIVELSIRPGGHWMGIRTAWLTLADCRALGIHLIHLGRES